MEVDILLPAPQTDMGLWPALACDQFTSQPEYWQKAEALTQNAPSTLHITLPEAYLESPDVDGRIAAIHTAMADYRARVLTRGVHGFVYVERATQSGVRQGLVGAVDLEAYSYEKGSAPLVRPSENTIVERIPPRLAVRRGAPLETPHIMMLLDDAACGVVEPFAKKKAALEKLYDTELMLGGGHIAGWAVTDAADIAAVENAVAALGTQAAFDAKYPDAAGRPPLAVAVGDGNHSLATAKAHWEEIKAALPPAARQSHPARWCLVELVNVHSPALGIEPIHRAVFGVSMTELAGAFLSFAARHGAHACGMAGAQQIRRFCIISAAGVGVADHHGDGGAGGMAVDHTAQKLHHIRLGAGGGKPISAGAAAVHPLGDVGFIHRQPRGQAVQHSADGGTVAFAKNGQAQCIAKGIFHRLSPRFP